MRETGDGVGGCALGCSEQQALSALTVETLVVIIYSANSLDLVSENSLAPTATCLSTLWEEGRAGLGWARAIIFSQKGVIIGLELPFGASHAVRAVKKFG